MAISMQPELRERVREAATREDVGVSEWVREAIDARIEGEKVNARKQRDANPT
jgi:predicted DNA-binding protein